MDGRLPALWGTRVPTGARSLLAPGLCAAVAGQHNPLAPRRSWSARRHYTSGERGLTPRGIAPGTRSTHPGPWSSWKSRFIAALMSERCVKA
jgi:hypothetical protein